MEPQLKVLLVDDDFNDLALFGIAVEHTECDIWLQNTSDGLEAIDYMEGRGSYADRSLYPLPGIILLDLQMPFASGFDFLKWRNGSKEFASVPVAILTGSADKKQVDKALGMGANKYFPKPDEFEAWKALVREVWSMGTQGL